MPSHKSTALRISRLQQETSRAGGLIGDIGGAIIGGLKGIGIELLGGTPGFTPPPFTPPPFTPPMPTGCEPGFERDLETGRCKRIGITGAVQRFLPGGETGFAPDLGVNGGALVPGAQAPRIRVTETRVCPKKFILGADGLCYVKALLPVKLRMHRPDRRPPISASQWAKLRTAETVRNKAKQIAMTAGFSCKKR